MNLNEKQWNALEAIVIETIPSAESMHADVVKAVRCRLAFLRQQTPSGIFADAAICHHHIAVQHPTLAEIDARAMRDAVVWTEENSTTMIACIPGWVLTARLDGSGDAQWTLRVIGEIHDAAEGDATSIVDAKVRCVEKLRSLGVTL